MVGMKKVFFALLPLVASTLELVENMTKIAIKNLHMKTFMSHDKYKTNLLCIYLYIGRYLILSIFAFVNKTALLSS